MYNDAINVFKVLLELNHDSSDAYALLGQCYSLMNNKEKAINCLKKTAELNPDDQEIKQILMEISN